MAGQRLRVTHVIHGLGPGGAEQVLVDLAGAFGAVGIDISVLSLMPTDGHAHPAGLRELGIPISTLSLPSRWDVRALNRATRVLAGTAPDVVHTHMKHADLVGAFAARRLRVPMVSTLHLIEDAPTPLDRAKRWLAAQARLRRAARTVTVSDAVRAWYLDTFSARAQTVITIRNGRATPPTATPDGRRRLRAELAVPDDAVLATVVGIMRPGKGHAAVLAAATRLQAGAPGSPDVRFVFAGDGPLRPELERQARAAGLVGGDRAGSRVSFAGYRDDVPALLQASDLLVHASDFDALPTALIEGLAAGLPTVAYSVGGVPEIVSPGTGCLVPAGDVAGLATAIAGLAADPDRRARMADAARSRFVTEFEVGAWAARLGELYREVRGDVRVVAAQ